MTECTGRAYWRKRINECMNRHIERHRRLEVYRHDGGTGAPHNANYRDWVQYQNWRDARTNYLRKQLKKEPGDTI